MRGSETVREPLPRDAGGVYRRARRALQGTVTTLGRFVPHSLRMAAASSSWGEWVRKFLDRAAGEPYPLVRLSGPLAGHRLRINWSLQKTYAFGTYEPHLFQMLSKLIQPGWTVVDVGAHVGYYTLFLAKCVGPAGRVLAFEPLAENFRMLLENITLNGYGNIVAENVALMERPGPIELRSATPGALTWVASAHVDPASAVQAESVSALSLDDYVSRTQPGRIGFLKIDVEGAEASVLEGARMVLERDKPFLLVELHGYNLYGESHPAVVQLKEHNYRLNYLGRRKWEMHVLAEPVE